MNDRMFYTVILLNNTYTKAGINWLTDCEYIENVNFIVENLFGQDVFTFSDKKVYTIFKLRFNECEIFNEVMY